MSQTIEEYIDDLEMIIEEKVERGDLDDIFGATLLLADTEKLKDSSAEVEFVPCEECEGDDEYCGTCFGLGGTWRTKK